jgi:hypothetical protein
MFLRNPKKFPVLAIVVFLFSLLGMAFAQGSGPILDVQLSPTLEFAQVVYTSDFDFYQQGATIYLFQATLDNTGKSAVQGVLIFEIQRGQDIIAKAQTTSFTLSANEVISASNMQISSGVITQSGDEIRLDESETFAPGDEFEKEVLSSGKLPRGNYQLVSRFRYSTGESPAPPLNLFLQNPSYVRPLTPGDRVGSGSTDVVYSQFPTMQFESDFDPQFAIEPPFRVTIYKKLDQHNSIDEVLTSTPFFDEFMYEMVFPYPAYGVQPLQPGIYAWRIQLRYITTSGTETLESPVFVFRAADPSLMGIYDDDELKEEIMTFLLDKIENKEDGREVIGNLSDYKLLSIKLNGKELTKQEFYDILEQYDSKLRKLSELILTPTH